MTIETTKGGKSVSLTLNVREKLAIEHALLMIDNYAHDAMSFKHIDGYVHNADYKYLMELAEILSK